MGFKWILPELFRSFYCVLGLRKLSLWYTNVLKWALLIFFIIVMEFWYVMWLWKSCLGYTKGVKPLLPKHFLTKIMKFETYMLHNELKWLLPDLYLNFYCVLGLKKLSLWYTNVLKWALPYFYYSNGISICYVT